MCKLPGYLACGLVLDCLAALPLAAQEKPGPAAEGVAVKSEQVAPVPEGGRWTRSPGQTRAVLLIHGFEVHLHEESVRRAQLHAWQRPGSTLVKELSRWADVYAFAYGQDAALPKIVAHRALAGAVARLRELGYRDVVLLGHSAGGLIAREFVEDHPDAGVTRVVQVCAPNAGTSWAENQLVRNQKDFLNCLTVTGREQRLKERVAIRIPEQVLFVCVVAASNGSRISDDVVPCASQWPADLRQQGIPAVALESSHRQAVRSPEGARLLGELVREQLPRWTAERVRAARRDILGPDRSDPR